MWAESAFPFVRGRVFVVQGRTAGPDAKGARYFEGAVLFFFFFFLSQRLEGEQVCKNIAGALIDQVLQLAFKHGYSRRVSPSFRCGAERGGKMRAEQHGACRCLIELQETRSKINAGRFRYLFLKADTP